MVKHVILWKIKEQYSEAEKETIKAEAKKALEALVGVVPGLTFMQINTQGLASSNADLMLDSTLVDEAALKAYAVHPAHVEVADTKVRPFMETRLCLDYEV